MSAEKLNRRPTPLLSTPPSRMTTRAIWNEEMDRAMEMATGGTPAPGQGALNAQHAAAVEAWDAWQRNQLPEDNSSYLPAAAVETACTAFVTLYNPPAADVHTYSLSQADKNSWEGLRMTFTPVDRHPEILARVIAFADKAGISQEEAEAVLANLKPSGGYYANALLAQQVFARFAKSKGITVTGAIITLRDWVEGLD